MKKIFVTLIMGFLIFGVFSCTPEDLAKEINDTAECCEGDIEPPPPPPPPPPTVGGD